ncbi:endonuclease Q family protein [Brevibacillus ruminantium]|uniref:Endonuclease Q family protein n=1 Tax=Brevibacillus ruminantium TaxID=2950604 RepID=A0ABY4WE70_9BACL|nr:endonuclease Q family protein [Brevibacillus ruminantium]USG63604.1 endonuclease Q family protein [Brevibacillus ruminantium]
MELSNQKLSDFFCDLHIHVGGTMTGKPVKITASRSMTLTCILEEASERKGMDMIGIIDAHSPEVQEELQLLMQKGEVTPHTDGGVLYKQTMLILGCEVEIKEENRGEAHFLCYLPDLARMREFTHWLSQRCKNVQLSSQRIRTTLRELQEAVAAWDGVIIPAHIFTPHKGLYGSCTDSLAEVADPAMIHAVELGLSANTEMADRLSELHDKTFLTNSDAHSLAKIGREYQMITMRERSFQEWVMALKREAGRGVKVNYGLHPQLGKYHQTACQSCQSLLPADPEGRCPQCGFKRVVRGVSARIEQLADLPPGDHPAYRPPYVEQVPLEFIPGVGPKLKEKLYQKFGTEMSVLHRTSQNELAAIAGERIAGMIVLAREGKLEVKAGGAGTYGKVLEPKDKA